MACLFSINKVRLFMDEFEALKLIGESGLVAEKMTDEERAAKRKARRDARRA